MSACGGDDVPPRRFDEMDDGLIIPIGPYAPSDGSGP
jgi:hypothetical protein